MEYSIRYNKQSNELAQTRKMNSNNCMGESERERERRG